MRLKIVETFSAGRPVVSTAKGVEGIEVVDGQHLLICEDADAMAAAIIELWGRPVRQNPTGSKVTSDVGRAYSNVQGNRALMNRTLHGSSFVPSAMEDLRLDSAEGRQVLEGHLACRCGRSSPVSVPRFVLGDTAFFGRHGRGGRTQDDSLNGTTIFRDRFESWTGWPPEPLEGKVFDLSVAIDACRELHGQQPSLSSGFVPR